MIRGSRRASERYEQKRKRRKVRPRAEQTAVQVTHPVAGPMAMRVVLASLGARVDALLLGEAALLDQPVGGEALRLERLDLSHGVLQANIIEGKRNNSLEKFIFVNICILKKGESRRTSYKKKTY